MHACTTPLSRSLTFPVRLSYLRLFLRARYFQKDWVKNLAKTTSSASPLIFSFPAEPLPAIAAAAPGSILLPSTVGRVEQRPAGEWVAENVS